MPRARLFAIASLALSCARAPAPSCRTVADCGRFDRQRVSVIGVYQALPHPKGQVRGELEPVLARVALDDPGPYLEPFYKKSAARDAGHQPRSACAGVEPAPLAAGWWLPRPSGSAPAVLPSAPLAAHG